MPHGLEDETPRGREPTLGARTTAHRGTPDSRDDFDDDRSTLDALQCIGRYLIRSRIGAGGMGTVLAGYDPELDRRVAIKLVRGLRDRDALAPSGARLRREAQSLARLSHPNVVAVHDAGIHGLFAYLVMEHVEGLDLRGWIKAGPHSWEARVSLLLAAGSGLAAAHAAGLAHCDIKPENILVGDDGRVRVADFGLARLRHALESDDPTPGVQFGTPAYMAPETATSGTVGPLADQYRFCVMGIELLTGRRPSTAHARDGSLVSRRGSRPRGAILAILERGLVEDPKQRFASMDALLAAIGQVRRRRGLFRLGLVTAVGLATGVSIAAMAADSTLGCSEVADALRSHWAAQKDPVREWLTSQPHPRSPAAWERVEAQLDTYVEDWSQRRDAACEALGGTGGQGQLSQRIECLEQRRATVTVWMESLGSADDALIERLASQDLQLPALEYCDDERALAQLPATPADPITAVLVGQAQHDLAEAATLRDAGHFADSETLLDQVEALAVQRKYPPLLAEATLARGRLLSLRRDDHAAEAAIRGAIVLAEHGVHPRVVGEAWIELAAHHVRRHGSIRDAEILIASADMVIEALGRPGDLVGPLALVRGRAILDDNRFEEACAVFEDLEATQPGIVERDQLAQALGECYTALNRFSDAMRWLDQALALREAELGGVHPAVAQTLLAQGRVHVRQQRAHLADAPLRRALEIRRNAYGDEHPAVADALNSLGGSQMRRGDLVSARTSLETAAGIVARNPTVSDLEASKVLSNLGSTYSKLGMHAEADAALLDARARLVRAVGPQHTSNALVLLNLSDAREQAGDFPGAVQWLQRAVDLLAEVPSRRNQRVRRLIHMADLLWDHNIDRHLARERMQDAAAIAGSSQAPVIAAWLAAHGEPDPVAK